MKVSDAVRDVLSHGVECSGNQLKLTTSQLDRKIYVQVAKVIEAIGGKWTRATQAFLFDSNVDAGGLISGLIAVDFDETQIIADADLGFFRTPYNVAQFLIPPEPADGDGGVTVLEPSAGEGDLVGALLKNLPRAEVIACEYHEGRRATLIKKYDSDGFYDRCHVLKVRDFFQVDSSMLPAKFHIAMNPPFAKTRLMKKDCYDHFRHAWDLLPVGCTISCVFPVSVLTNTRGAPKLMREFLSDKHGDFIELEDGAFRPSGTNVRAVIWTGRKEQED